ncbi:MAG TPA: VWA domain-containing protein [Bryobacteraceae bacterium]|nr:VWA domain-containing protein [Bryobacteraceae bacterium]
MKILPILVALAPAAFPQDSPTIKVDVNLVNVLCTVRNKANGIVGNLEKSDFKIYEDGKEQDIKYFTRETDLPLTIGMMVDTSGSQRRLVDDERRAASQFFAKVLRKKDLAFLMQFGTEAELLQDDTSSPRLLQDALNQLHMSVGVGGLHPGPVPTQQSQAGTVLFDAVYLAATEKMKMEVGRKAMILITDGVDEGSKTPRDKAIEEAQKSDSIIYSIDYEDPAAYGGFGVIHLGGGMGEGDLRKMSSETGGRVYKVDRHNSLDDIFQDLQNDLRSQYSIGYQPPNPNKDGSYHKIDIKVDNKEYKVEARKGYYAVESAN